MALAAAVGSGYRVNQANRNQYSQLGVKIIPAARCTCRLFQNRGDGLSVLLDTDGVSLPGAVCATGLDGNCPTGSCGLTWACGIRATAAEWARAAAARMRCGGWRECGRQLLAGKRISASAERAREAKGWESRISEGYRYHGGNP